MLLTISLAGTPDYPATDLGHLLHKNPANVQRIDMGFGAIHIVYPHANHEFCTAALLLDIDPIGLVRGDNVQPGLADYVSDRPYVASSFMSVALGKAFGTAMSGRSKDRQELADTPLPFTVEIAVIKCNGGAELIHRLFEPLGYTVQAEPEPLDELFPAWGDSPYFTVRLQGTVLLKALLEHLYVLLPALDDKKHYYAGKEELEKLLRRGGDWLKSHPEQRQIIHRYLRRNRKLADEAMARLAAEVASTDPEEAQDVAEETELSTAGDKPVPLNTLRMEAVAAKVQELGVRSVCDVGCGEGKLLRLLMKQSQLERLAGTDVLVRSLEYAKRRLKLDALSDRQRERITLFQGSLVYRDDRLKGYDVITATEVIEHLEPERLVDFERFVFGHAQPGVVILTTPNIEYNVLYPFLPPGQLRHDDHRFEWTRAEFEAWAHGVAERHGYTVEFFPVGTEDEKLGSPTQMGVFTRV